MSKVNLATGDGGSGRQAGSAFKPFTLAAAMRAGLSTSTRTGTARRRSRSRTPPATRTAQPGSSRTRPTRRAATSPCWRPRRTRSTPSSRRSRRAVAPEAIVETAHRIGHPIASSSRCARSRSGPQAVNPLEMTNAYATLAARGCARTAASPLERVDDRGRQDRPADRRARAKLVLTPERRGPRHLRAARASSRAGPGTAARHRTPGRRQDRHRAGLPSTPGSAATCRSS